MTLAKPYQLNPELDLWFERIVDVPVCPSWFGEPGLRQSKLPNGLPPCPGKLSPVKSTCAQVGFLAPPCNRQKGRSSPM